ncbi:MAG: hypothetical protein WBH03_13040 [Cyclobacteriaceae bacterium]
MKNTIKICSLVYTYLFFSTISAYSQSITSGIYMTYRDYSNQEMKYAINCDNESHKIRPHGTWRGDKFVVDHDGERFSYERSEIFGYKDCYGKDWRVFGDYEYLIKEAKSLIIYERYKHENVTIDDDPILPTYHFSIGNGDIQELTLMNLKKAFPEEHAFHDKLDETFTGGRVAASYDKYHKTYKVNRVFANTVKSKNK